jgi:hypothetical protein
MDRLTGGCLYGDVRIGSSVFGRTGDEIELNLGSLDAPDQLKPIYEL